MVSERAMRQRAAETALRAARSADSCRMKRLRRRRSGEERSTWGCTWRGLECTPALYLQTCAERRLLLGGVAAVLRSARAGRPDEQLLAIREGDIAAIRARRAVLGLEALDEDLS